MDVLYSTCHSEHSRGRLYCRHRFLYLEVPPREGSTRAEAVSMLLNFLWKERSTNAPFGEDPSIILRANGVIHNPLGPPLSKGEGRREKVRAEAIPPRVEGSTRFRGLPLRLTLPNGGTKSPSLREDGGLGVLPEKDLRIPPEYIFPHRGIKGGTIMQTKSFGRFTLCRG